MIFLKYQNAPFRARFLGQITCELFRKSQLGETIDFLALAVQTLSAGDSSMALFGKKLEIWPSPGYVRYITNY